MTDIHEDTDTITIGQKQLLTDLDLYVANGNPDISPNFSSIQKALNYLGQYVIPTTIKARINVSPGTYTSSTPILIDHPNSQSITVQGPQNTPVAGTSINIAGSANNWNLTVNGIPNTSQFVVNDYAIINYVGGVTNITAALICGFFKILSKTASSVTVRVMNYKASFSVVGCNNVRITPVSVILTTSAVNSPVVRIGSYGVRLFQYMGVVATVAPTLAMTAISISGNSSLKCVGVTGFNLTVNAAYDNTVHAISSDAFVACDACAVTWNQCGLVGGGACAYQLRGCAVTYNNFRGLWLEGGSASFVYEPSFFGGNYYGMVSSSNAIISIVATVPAGYVICQKNDYWGLFCFAAGGLNFSSTACTLWAADNGLSQPTKYDIVVQNYGLVSGSVCVIGTRIFNSPVGTINSTGGLIN